MVNCSNIYFVQRWLGFQKYRLYSGQLKIQKNIFLDWNLESPISPWDFQKPVPTGHENFTMYAFSLVTSKMKWQKRQPVDKLKSQKFSREN